jgi:hypothetical protein
MTAFEVKIKVIRDIILSLMALLPVMVTAQALVPGQFEVLGLGGAGGMYTPSVSPLGS